MEYTNEQVSRLVDSLTNIDTNVDASLDEIRTNLSTSDASIDAIRTNLSTSDASIVKIPKNIGFEPSVGTAGNTGDCYLDPSNNFYLFTGTSWLQFLVDPSVYTVL